MFILISADMKSRSESSTHKLVKVISFELMHPYNTLSALNCKIRLQLKKITITNIWNSTSISTFDALSKWLEPDAYGFFFTTGNFFGNLFYDFEYKKE